MSTTIHLHHGALRCELTPALGGSIAGLWLDDIAVLRSTAGTDLQRAAEAGSYPLVPYSNRIGQAIFHWAGQSHRLRPNHAPEPHAIHGVGWERPWTVLSANACEADLAYEHLPDEAWPFAFAARQRLALSSGRLSLRMRLTNRSATTMPAGLGWHPYFMKRPGCHLRFEASGRWEMDAAKLPTHRLPVTGLATHCDRLTVDHCYDGWTGTLELHDTALRTRVESDLQRLVVFTHPGLDCLAVEPVSHVNNALQLMQSTGIGADALGLIALQPGASMSAHLHIQTEHQP